MWGRVGSGTRGKHHLSLPAPFRPELVEAGRKKGYSPLLQGQREGEPLSSIEVKSANLDQIVVGKLDAKWSARGDRILRYYIDFRHKSLNVHKEVSAPELFILQEKVDALMASWDEKYVQFKIRAALRLGSDTASDLEAEEHEKRRKFQKFLEQTLNTDDRVDWDSLKNKKPFKRDIFQEPSADPLLAGQTIFQIPGYQLFPEVIRPG